MQSLNEQLAGITGSFRFMIPELILSAFILVILVAGLFNNKSNGYLMGLSLLAVGGSMTFILWDGFRPDIILFDGMLRREGLGEYMMMLVDVAVALTCFISGRPRARHLSEYYALLLSVALGCHLLVMSSNLLLLFVSLELISICSYVLAGYAFDKQGSEASLKYFLFGAIASAIMLYGFTILYGMTGTLDFTSPQFFNYLINHPTPMFLIAGLMAIAGFLFKMGAVPMHPWAPDVYEAAPIPVIAFLSVAPKLAALGILTKFVLALHLFGQGGYDWQLIVAAISILTITVGNFSALWQTNPKRMMAYSSIAQTGFLLIGIVVFLPQGVRFMLFYAAVYLMMNFAVFIYLRYFEARGIVDMKSFSGRGKHYIWAAVGLTLALVSLTGLPPTAGFSAKVFLFSTLWEAYSTTRKTLLLCLLIFGLLNTVVSLFYYLRIPYFAFIKADAGTPLQKSAAFENLLGFILVVGIVVIFFIPGLLMGWINKINFVL